MRKFSFLLLTVFFFAIANAMESGTKTICSNFSGLATNLKVLNIKSEVTPLLNYYISIDAKTITYTSNTTKKDITEFGVNCNCKTDDFKIHVKHFLTFGRVSE